jgi:hypothetical protein
VTNIRLVDVVFEGAGYKLGEADKAAGVKVVRSRGAVCDMRHCAIPRNAYYLYSRRDGRICCRCAINLGALEESQT